MLDNCPLCGKYTIEKPCYNCVEEERDKYKKLAAANVIDLANERDKYKKLYQMAVGACPQCNENCVVRRLKHGKREAK
jgi:recombinational DNA repair protein RecR